MLVVGPGLGQSPWSEQLLQLAAASGKPMVLDADGLNLLAAGQFDGQPARQLGADAPPGRGGPLAGVHHCRGAGRPFRRGAHAATDAMAVWWSSKATAA